jgi:hypothetical protein
MELGRSLINWNKLPAVKASVAIISAIREGEVLQEVTVQE